LELHDSDLAAIDLEGADLVGVNLAYANLTFAKLNKANLGGSDLHGADLSHADLGDAFLREANLSGARLVEANLASSYLFRVLFRKTNLDNTKLSNAECVSSIFANVDLSSAKDLDKVTHLGPSTLGIDTLARSAGQIPEVFLRGCGLPESLIRSLPGLVLGKECEFYSCFISYSHADREFADRLHNALQDKGIRCWLDERQLLPGDDIYEQVDRGIRLWDKVLLCASENSLTSWWVDSEIDKAFEKERQLFKARGKKVLSLVPLDLDGHLFHWANGKSTEVKRRLAADFTGWQNDEAKFERELEKLADALRADEGGREPPPPQLL
jgi:hypothetical protein